MKKYEKINIEIIYLETSDIMNGTSIDRQDVDTDDYAVM